MSSNMKNMILGGLIILSSTALLALLVSFSIYLYSKSKQTNMADVVPNSAYISEDIGLLDDNPSAPEEITKESVTPEPKKGIIQKDETRKIVNVGKTLTESEIQEIEEKYAVEFSSDTPKKGIYVVTTSSESKTETLQEDLNATVEVDIPVRMSAQTLDWGVTRIGADKVWSKSTGTGVKVAVIDTGVERTHSDLSSNIVAGYDYVNNDTDPTDDNGHGTHVAGIIASVNNTVGNVGVANKTQIMPVKVLNNQGYGYLSDVAKGVYFATDNGARIINMSLGSTSDSLTLKNAITYATQKGVLVIAAAGNSSGQPCEYPAAYTSVVCVVATDTSNKLASFSNMGGELAAPGVSNYSSYIGNTYRYMSGTSMATPHVAGAAAVILSMCNSCSTTDVRNLLRSTAVDLGVVGRDSVFGYGLVDLVSASATFEQAPAPEETVTPTPEEPTTPVVTPPATVKPQKRYPKQKISIVEPKETSMKRYIPTVQEDITIKFTLDPLSEESNFKESILTVNNIELYATELQNDEYIVKKELLDSSQHWVKVTSYFEDGTTSSDSMIIDLTSFRRKSLRQSDRSVLGIATSAIFDFTYFLFGR